MPAFVDAIRIVPVVKILSAANAMLFSHFHNASHITIAPMAAAKAR